ncbi:hypothetical protein HHK36_013483 [Tetracentron sinense]|uniref:Uncharacterized protein n=1 Tax=Tetracentron sinense TaxID=13715 RepID=A0A835DGS1_TETSI|nr:hypothetical protein HHK36_013483 [Tetracentron sinense]
MMRFASLIDKIQLMSIVLLMKFVSFSKSLQRVGALLCRPLIFLGNPFSIQLLYLVFVSFVGFLGLKSLGPRREGFRPKELDVFFMSVSATTDSSMSTVEMEAFSDTQLLVFIFLMLLGGEVFTSMLGLQMKISNYAAKSEMPNFHRSRLDMYETDSTGTVGNLKYNSLRYLRLVVLNYLIWIHVCGISVVLLYLRIVQSASDVLKNKGLPIHIFSVFMTVSSFTNCGFLPTNENMVVFKKNSGFLILIIPQLLIGNTMFPMCLRLVIWVLWKFTKRAEFDFMLKNPKEMGYDHLLSSPRSCFLGLTALGFMVVQFVLFCSMEWNSEAMEGLNFLQKIIGILFQSVNSRHAGESIFDLSVLSPAILVLYIVMMYLPPYTCFFPTDYDDESSKRDKEGRKRRRWLMEGLKLSQISYLVIFVILICITERDKIKEDPLNFNVINIIIEVTSAYGNVGFSTGYSCKRQIKPDGNCKDAWYGFAGRWSNKGKLVLIFVMFFGKLKKFNMRGGNAWKLS